MKNVIYAVLPCFLLFAAMPAFAGDPVPTVAAVPQCAVQQQIVTIPRTCVRTVYDEVTEQVQVPVTKTRMVPREVTVTQMVPEQYTEMETQTVVKTVPRQETYTVEQQYAMVPVAAVPVAMVPVKAKRVGCLQRMAAKWRARPRLRLVREGGYGIAKD